MISNNSLGLKRDALIRETTRRSLTFTGHGSYGDLYHSGICLKDETAKLKKYVLLECIDNNVLTQDPMLTNNEELTMDVKVGDCLGYSDHKMIDFKIRAKSRNTTLDFRSADVNLLTDLFGRITWVMSLERKEV